MSEIESILEAVRGTLEDAGVRAVTAFPAGGFRRYKEPVCAVGLASGQGVDAGFAEYIGERTDAAVGKTVEVYGKRLELGVEVRIYSPKGEPGTQGCLDTMAKIIAALPRLPVGIRIRGFTSGEVNYDAGTDMILAGLTLNCVCFFYAETADEEFEILDFKLKGAVIR